jgi:hypothetical protein
MFLLPVRENTSVCFHTDPLLLSSVVAAAAVAEVLAAAVARLAVEPAAVAAVPVTWLKG